MEYGTGAIESSYDPRDYWYEPSDKGAFDWEKGFDIEEKLKTKIVIKNQNGSGSCGGQAWSYYGEVLEAIVTGTYEPRSARWIYSHTRHPDGGSAGRDNCSFCVKNGWVSEKYASSYDHGKPPKEEFMSIVPILDKDGIEDNGVTKALSYLNVPVNIEVFAQAIQDNNGLVLVLNGQDNGTWRQKFPAPPLVKEWGHFLYAGKAKMINGKKYIGVAQSWGTNVGDDGWQWLGEEWFANPKLGIREGWTMAWDYKPAAHKVLLIKTVKLLTQLVALLQAKKQISTK